jgi:hypothetical protein
VIAKCLGCGNKKRLKSKAKRLCPTCYARAWQRAKRAEGVCYRKEEPCITCGKPVKMRREFRCGKCFYAHKKATDPEWVEKRREYNRKFAKRKYETNPEHRESRVKYSREYRQL